MTIILERLKKAAALAERTYFEELTEAAAAAQLLFGDDTLENYLKELEMAKDKYINVQLIYEGIWKALAALQIAEVDLINQERILAQQKTKLLNSGEIEGKNEAVRKAALDTLLSDLLAQVDSRRTVVLAMRSRLDIAKVGERELNMRVRLAELRALTAKEEWRFGEEVNKPLRVVEEDTPEPPRRTSI